jgi:hypothetical protein
LCKQEAINGANRVVDEDADDRKGGAGHLGKAFFSGKRNPAILSSLPSSL